MIYSNIPLWSAQTIYDSGIINSITLGESNEHGQNLVHLVCCSETVIHKGMNANLTISFSINNNPKITRRKDDNLYMLLSTKAESTLSGNGVVLVQEGKQNLFKVLARARGGDVRFTSDPSPERRTGYLEGYWEHLLIQVPTTNVVLQVCKSGSMYGNPPNEIYVIHEGIVHYCTYKTLEQLCSAIKVPVPCEVFPNSWGNLKLGGSWVRL